MKGKNTGYQEKLDHLRFFAAFLIILYHSVWTYRAVAETHPVCKWAGGASMVEPPFFSLILEGHTAVALFMTLSGFLFATICKGKEIDHWGFYRNRFLRIYPLFIVVLLLACYINTGSNNFVSLLTSLFFMQNTQSAVYMLNGTESLWAIAVEFQFYLLFPWLLIFFRKYGYKYLVGLVALALLTRVAVYFASFNDLYTVAYTTIFGRIDQFLIGMMCGFFFDDIKARLRHPLILAGSVASVFAVITFFHQAGWAAKGPHWIFATDVEGLIWGLIIVAYSASSFSFPKSIGRFLAFAGSLSYSLYLIHPAVLRLAWWFTPMIYWPHSKFPLLAKLSSQLSHDSYIAGVIFGLGIALPVTFLVSMLTYNFIEKPFLELRSTYTKRGKSDRDELESISSTTPELVGAAN